MTDRLRGRPRDEQIDIAVRAAVAEVLDAAGYGALSMEDVARRAGVSKSALYRRWPDRPRLVLDALQQRMSAVAEVNSGCTLCDLHDILTMTTRVYSSLGPGTLARLLGEASTDASLHEQLLNDLVEPLRAAVRHTLDRARSRGDLRPGADLELSAETMCALSLHRLLLERRPLTGAEIEHVISGVLGGVAADYGGLLEQFHAREGEPFLSHDRDRHDEKHAHSTSAPD